MASPSIPPLRYQKGSHGNSPTKAMNRPLSELSPMAIRRNSPSFPQGKSSIFKSDSSPAGSSPFSANITNSPHMFWRGRDPASPSRENQSPHEAVPPVSPSKRSSIENLKKASRVKNSNIFAKEQQHLYDPAKTPTVLDGRPLSTQIQGNAYGGRGLDELKNDDNFTSPSSTIDFGSKPQNDQISSQTSPRKTNASPTKSSLSKKTGSNFRYSSFDPETGIWEDGDTAEKRLPEGHGLHQHTKSVTFDKAPPQVNEYEMTTPVPSSVASGSREGSYDTLDDEEDELSFERGSSMDIDDSFDASLEDTEKTPVVLPEDWRFMSPDIANTQLAQHEEDVFDDDVGSPAPTAHPGKMHFREHQTSVNSVDSDGQTRPLPPLPPLFDADTAGRRSRDSLSGTIERMSSGQRALPSPPQAPTLSKSDLRSMSRESLSIEDRIRLMMINKPREQEQKVDTDMQHEYRTIEINRTDSDASDKSNTRVEGLASSSSITAASNTVPRLDRLSIMKQLRSTQGSNASSINEEDLHDDTPAYDPDVPIPSLEDPTQNFEATDDVVIKQEESDDDNGLYSIPDMYCQSSADHSEAEDGESSEYSQQSAPDSSHQSIEHDVETPRAQSPVNEPQNRGLLEERMSLPDFTDFGDESSFNFGLSSYMTPPSENADVEKPLPKPPTNSIQLSDLAAVRQSIQRPYTPDEQLEPPKLSFSGDDSSADPGTPSSVIRHPMSFSPEPQAKSHETSMEVTQEELDPSPESELAPVDDETKSVDGSKELPMAPASATEPTRLAVGIEPATKRVSSLVQLEISQGTLDLGLGLDLETDFDRVVETQKVAFELSLQRLYHPFHGRFPSGDLPTSQHHPQHPLVNDLSSQRLIGARALPGTSDTPKLPFIPGSSNFANNNFHRQRGYLMRQNTKVVVASERGHLNDELRLPPPISDETSAATDVEPNEVRTSRKTSQPTWTAEPWSNKSRRRSIRVGGEKATAKRKPVDGPIPPLPGHASNVQDNLGAVAEDELAEEEAEEPEDGVERGRLFVKVVGVKDLQLPLPQYERTSFALTLDNGLHCVTTAWLDFARAAPIGQEFELVVLNDLEFQLTLQMKLEPPKVERAPSPSKPPSSPKKQGAFGRLFGSPKKRKESDQRFSQAQEIAQRPVTPPSAYELVQGLVAKDGSFARAYVSLSEHEKQAYGRPYHVDIKCFNEWAMEEIPVGSSRSKKSVSQLQQRPPYEIGKLELQLLYVPKPKGAKDEDMPKSMNGAIRALKEAEERMKQQVVVKEFEGYLSQQGGDCPYWRRRYFKLVGSKFTAYHESTLQPRATINLGKASKLINDKSSLTQKETSTRGGGRRKSAFAEEEEGYMFVEEGFRIKFANGEVIDFYADSPARKDEWMHVLSQVVGKNITASSVPVRGWAEMVLKREKSTVAKTMVEVAAKKLNKEARHQERSTGHQETFGGAIPTSTHTSALPRPSGHTRTESFQPGYGSRSQASSPVKAKLTSAERREKAKSMAF